MTQQTVILAHPFAAEVMAELAAGFRLIVPAAGRSLAETVRAEPAVEGLISFLSDPVDHDLLAAAPNLKIVANFAVGIDNIDVAAARARGIYVTNTPDILTEATADLTWALLLSVARRIVEADRFTRDGRFSGWQADLLLGKELAGGTCGVVGLGRIGSAVARRALGFGMRVLYTSRHRQPDLERQYGFEATDFSDLLRRADVVSAHLAYEPELHHLFDRDAFALMKPDAIFLNVARGALVNEAALIEALEEGRLFGAGLDVYEAEPVISARLRCLPNVVLAPHIGSATTATRTGMARMAAVSVGQALAGRIPDHLVPEWSRQHPSPPAPG